jgi:glycosyltransferase involved in cell wall biosynthesis
MASPQEGAVEWWGHRNDMPDVLRQACVAYLPSYRERLPKSLLEAGACGLPIITIVEMHELSFSSP